jgi:hypothetical protein
MHVLPALGRQTAHGAYDDEAKDDDRSWQEKEESTYRIGCGAED